MEHEKIWAVWIGQKSAKVCVLWMFNVYFLFIRGGVSFNTAGSLSTALLWKLSRRNVQFPRTWNNIKKVTFQNTFP